MPAPHLNTLIASRRALLGGFAGLPLLHLGACATPGAVAAAPGFESTPATNADTITLPPGYSWRTLIAWGDPLAPGLAPFDADTVTRADQEQRFGTNSDMLALFAANYAFPPPRDQDRLLLCANNEYASVELMLPSLTRPETITAAQIEAILAAVGVSVVAIARGEGGWRADAGDPRNRRITPFSPVLFSGPAARHPWIVAAARVVNAAEPDRTHGAAAANTVRCGTMANCAGGLTPWGTYLTAEENFDEIFFGEPQRGDDAYALDLASFGYPHAMPLTQRMPRQFQIAHNPHGPALYGWIVEIDPHDPHAPPKKRTALGRKKAECATTALTGDGRVAVYMGDDERDEHVYKFVSRGRFDPRNRTANMDLLDEGQLYCARFEEDGGGRWIAITAQAANAAAQAADSPIRFRDEADVLMRARIAARLLGATPMDRPEDIETVCDEAWRGLGPVLIACTNNSARGFSQPGNPRRESADPNTAQNNLPGHILRIDEAGGDCGAEHFTWDIFAMGGDPNASELTAPTRRGAAHVSVAFDGAPTISGDRFACPDNLFIDSQRRVWIATDGASSVFADCNDSVLTASIDAPAPRPMKRFLVGPVGSEICGPLMTPDERAFLCAIQHPGAVDLEGASYGQTRWAGATAPPSTFPDGGWPRSAVVIVTRDDGGAIGD